MVSKFKTVYDLLDHLYQEQAISNPTFLFTCVMLTKETTERLADEHPSSLGISVDVLTHISIQGNLIRVIPCEHRQNERMTQLLPKWMIHQNGRDLYSKHLNVKETLEPFKGKKRSKVEKASPEKEWYGKLAAKLQLIKSGELKLDDYIVEVDNKIHMCDIKPHSNKTEALHHHRV